MNEGDFLWLAILSVSQVANLVATLSSFRRKPPMAEELYKDFLAKSDHELKCKEIQRRMEALDNHNTATHVQIFAAIRQNQVAVQTDFQTLERGLGRVEGQLKRIAGETE